MEAPVVLIEKPTPENKEKNLINVEVSFNDEKYDFNVDITSEDKIKFVLSNKDINNYIEYTNIFNLENFRSINKYFKMFDSLNEIGEDLISIVKENNYDITNDLNDTVSINLKIFSRSDSLVSIKLEKSENKEKEKISILYDLIKECKRNLETKDAKISELENKIALITKSHETFKENILEELNKKEERIQALEKDIDELKNIVNNSKTEIIQKNEKVETIQKNEKKETYISTNIFNNILENSNIFQNADEIVFLLEKIPNSHYKIKMVYNSKIDGENEDKLINSYIDKNDLIFLIKTDKLGRFGGYTHESFRKDKFKKSDKNAFLFNLNKKTIYNSTGKERSIWRGFNTSDSINFGNGVDLKIFHKYWKKQSKTHQGNHDYDYRNEDYALNGEESFNISFLEIYQVYLITYNDSISAKK